MSVCFASFNLQCASYCRGNSRKGGFCIFVNRNITFTDVYINKCCIDYDTEPSSLKIYLNNTALYILTVCRSPAGDFKKFLEKLDNILEFLINTKMEVIICGDTNLNYLINSIS